MRTAAFGRTGAGKRQRFEENDSDDERAPQQKSFSAPKTESYTGHSVVTSVNDDGSEVPSRLNNKVFIDGLPFNHDPAKHDHKTLEELMSQYLSDWKVGRMMHMSKKPGQGFAYVAFRSPNSVEVAIKVLNGRKFLGRPLRVELPKTAKAAPSAFQARHSDINSTVDRQVLITDLAKMAEPEIIRQVLRDAAPQLEAKIETIKVTSGNRKAFLTLSAPEDVEFAVKFLNGYQLLGRTIGATRAMAPGSLPYSKRPPPSGSNVDFTNGANPNAATGYGEEAEAGEDEDLPLGVAPKVTPKAAPTTAAAAASPKAAATPPARAATAALTKVDLEKRIVYVGGVGEDTTEGMLKQHFANCGIIRSVKIATNPHTHQPTGVAIVTFAMPSSAEFAIRNLNGSLLNGCSIRVDREDGEAVDKDKIPTAGAKGGKGGASRVDGQKEEKEEEVLDTDAFFKARGIRNPEAYFASVPKEAFEKKEPVPYKWEVMKMEKDARKLAAKAAAAATTAAAAAPSTTSASPAAAKKEQPLKEKKAPAPAPAAAPIQKNVVSFDYDDEPAKRPAAGGDDDSDEEERFVDVDAKKPSPSAKKEGGGKKIVKKIVKVVKKVSKK